MTTATGPRRPRPVEMLAHPWAGAVAGCALLVGIWAAASTVLPSRTIVPTPWRTAAAMAADAGSYYGPNIAATLERAGWGYLWGNAVGLLLAVVVILVPLLEDIVVQLGVISQCVPITAVGPIIIMIFNGQAAAVFLSGLLVFFTTMVGVLLGIGSAPTAALDVVRAYGGSRLTRIRKVQLLAALPSTLTALKIAVPAAVLGAVVAEFLGGVDSGIGVALASAQRNIVPERVWGLSILSGVIALAGYGLMGLLRRVVTPWATSTTEGVGR